MSDGRVLGVDGCKAGWIGIALSGGRTTPYFASRIGELVEKASADGPLDVVAVDIPIGLADASRRKADVLARKALGRRWMSVFITPVRSALLLQDYEAASAENLRIAGERISRQAYGLRAKILDADIWVRQTSLPAAEVHPELAFAELAGQPLRLSKTTWAGVAMRRTLLAEAGITLADDLGMAGEKAGIDDMLDAAAAAWTARRIASGSARPLPDPPETFSDGIACAIWT